MIAKFRQALSDLGGVQSLVAVFAIGWGLSTLQAVVEKRQALLDAQAAELAAQEVALRELAKLRHPAAPAPEEYITVPEAEEDQG